MAEHTSAKDKKDQRQRRAGYKRSLRLVPAYLLMTLVSGIAAYLRPSWFTWLALAVTALMLLGDVINVAHGVRAERRRREG